MAALGRIMVAVRAHSVNGVCGDVDPGRCLPAFRCVQSLSGRAPSPARSGMWHLLGDAGCPLWPFVASGPSCLFCFSHNKNIQFSVFISSHFGSITTEGTSHCGQREGHLVE